MLLDFSALFWETGLSRNFLAMGLSESQLLADAERSMQYWLNAPWNIRARQSIGEAGFG